MNIKYSIIALLFLTQCHVVSAQSVENTDTLAAYYKMLPEVVVKSEKPIVKLEQGKMSFNMSNLLEKIPADNAFDAIKNIPGVMAPDDNISYAGSPITLIINGKPTTLSQEQVIARLKSMPSAQLSKAELMLAAPAKYHVRGAAINVVTKDYAGEHHTSGQLQGTYNQSKYARGYGKANLLHVNGNFTLDVNYAYTYGKNYGEVEHEAQHPLDDGHVPYADKTRSVSKGFSHDFRAEADYRFGKNHDISVAYTGNVSKSDSHNTTTGSSIADQTSVGHNYLHNIDLNYTLPFGLRLSAAYTYYKSPRDQHLDGTLEDIQRNLTAESRQTINKWLFTADQSHTLSQDWELNYGLKFQQSNNNSFQTTLDAQGEAMPEATSSVDIDERIASGYLGFSKQFGKNISLEGSVAVENYHTPVWNEWHVYPSFNATWMVNRNNILNLSFSSDAKYPDYWSTMNQIFYSSPYSEIWGNPMLKPSSDYKTSLTWQYKRKYTFVAFADINPDFFVQLPYQPSDRMAVVMKTVNFSHRNTYGLQAVAQFGIGSWLQGNAFLAVLYTNDKCDDFFDIAFDRKKFSARFGGNATFTLSKRHRLYFIATPVFQSPAIQGVYDIKSIFTLGASLRWSSNNGAWNVIASGNNLTNSKVNTSSTFANQNYCMRVGQNWTTGALTIIYKFGNYKAKQHKEVDTSRLRK